MTTTAAVIDRVRLEIGDSAAPFISNAVGDGHTTVFELPMSPVDAAETIVRVNNAVTGAYIIDAKNGVLEFDAPPALDDDILVNGVGFKYFSQGELALFVDTAVHQHLHNRAGVTLATLPPVEEYLVALLTAIEALYALLNDAAFDIDVSTPEGVGIPRSQRFRQLQEMIELRKQQYAEMSSALNVGLNRIEVFQLRRVSRTTGRLVPVFLPQELEDATAPRRVYPAIDSNGARPIHDPVDTHDLVIEQGIPLSLEVDAEMDLTEYVVKAQLRRNALSAPLLYFDVERTADPQVVILHLRDTSRHRLYFDGDLFWDLRVEEPIVDGRRIHRTLVKGKVEVIERPRF